MTTRPDDASLQLLRGTRTKRIAHFVRVTRTDGQVFRWTDHDRRTTVIAPSGESAVYEPVIFAGASADRREAALKTPEQNTIGIIDGDVMNIPDLLGQRYRGAEVQIIRADWRHPWRQFSVERRTIRNVRFAEHRFVAMMDGITQKLERVSGGRFGGVMTFECPYVLGGEHCKKNISAWQVTGARVLTVNDDRSDVEMRTATWPTAETDEFYRYGEIEWLWAAPDDTAQVTTTTTATTLQSTGAGWTPDEHIGKTARILSGNPGETEAYAEITDNTADQLTFESTAGMSGHASGKWFDIAPDCDNKGVITEIARYTAATRRVEMFTPTPFPIAVDDSGIVRVGCDGLFTTCDSKFSNHLNFGGVHIQPQPGDQWEVTP